MYAIVPRVPQNPSPIQGSFNWEKSESKRILEELEPFFQEMESSEETFLYRITIHYGASHANVYTFGMEHSYATQTVRSDLVYTFPDEELGGPYGEILNQSFRAAGNGRESQFFLFKVETSRGVVPRPNERFTLKLTSRIRDIGNFRNKKILSGGKVLNLAKRFFSSLLPGNKSERGIPIPNLLAIKNGKEVTKTDSQSSKIRRIVGLALAIIAGVALIYLFRNNIKSIFESKKVV